MNLSLLSAAILSIGLLIGLVPALVDGASSLLQARFSLPDGKAEWHARLFYFSWIAGMPLAGFALDYVPVKECLFFSLVATLLAVTWLALARSYRSALASAVFLGLAYSCLAVIGVSLMSVGLLPARNQAAALNLGFVATGLGTLIGQALPAFVERRWGFRQGLLGIAVVLLAPAGVMALCERSLFVLPAVPALAWDTLLGDQFFALLAGMLLIYAAIEACSRFWSAPYLTELGHQAGGQALALTTYTLTFIALRGAAAWWLYYFPEHTVGLALLFVILAALVLGNLIGGYEMGSGTFWFWFLGGCYGPLLPCFLALALDLREQPLPASALGALLALGSVGPLVVRPSLNSLASGRSARIVMRVPTVLALLLAAPLILMLFLGVRSRP